MSRATAYLLSILSLVALPVLPVACGGGEPPPPATPSSPAPVSSEAMADAGAAPAASASASAAPAPVASAAPAASSAPAAPAAPEPPGPGQWDTWSKDQKLAYMKSAVMPKMGPMFHDFDAKKYAETKCVLCHGAGAKDKSFKMPNAGLPKLPTTPDGMKKLHETKAEMVEFMSKQVVPTTASLLGKEPYDPKTKKGFGCFGCHTKK
jgi:hypothetical protein